MSASTTSVMSNAGSLISAARSFIGLLVLLLLVGGNTGWADEIRQGPQRISPSEQGVGRLVADVAFTDAAGKKHKLSDFAQQKFTVLAMTSTSCPLSRKYLPDLAALAKDYQPRGVQLILVNPMEAEEAAAVSAAQQELGQHGLYVLDGKQTLARALRAKSTTDVIVLDAARTIVYHGAISDQYGFGYSLDAPKRNLLPDALDSLLAGLQPAIVATDAPGCALDLEPVTSTSSQPVENSLTWHNRISRIVQQNCVECHRPGGVAPFSLQKPDEVIAHRAMIQNVIDRGIMPPWFAAPAEARHVSPWSNERTLAEAEKQDLLAWLASKDRPLGDERDAPRPREFAAGWLIGKPDAVFEFAQPVAIKATGTMPYQHVIIETELPEDQWVQAIEIQPSAREVVHHVVVSLAGTTAPAGDGNDAAAEERSGFWALYVPGQSTLVYPTGYAKKLPRGARLRFQMHYTPNGTATEDRTRIGMVYAKQPPKHEIRVAGIVNPRLNIPPGADNHQEEASLRLPANVQVLALLPHMHLRGKACRYEAISKDGTTTTLLDVPRYDFNWQLLYRFAEPVSLNSGDTIRFTAWFDNSVNNPANPDPTKTVRWGQQTYEEMHLGYVEYIVPDLTPGQGLSPKAGRLVFGIELDALFKRIDQDGDQGLSKEEFFKASQLAPRLKDKPAVQQALFARLDADQNSAISPAEFEQLLEIIRQAKLE